MPTCTSCQCVVRPNDPQALTLTYNHRALVLCRTCGRIVTALLADMRLTPPLEVIR